MAVPQMTTAVHNIVKSLDTPYIHAGKSAKQNPIPAPNVPDAQVLLNLLLDFLYSFTCKRNKIKLRIVVIINKTSGDISILLSQKV